MENTLERLLRIQGQPEQISMETCWRAAGEERQAAPPAIAPQKENPGSPMLEAWRGAYRLFTTYAPGLRLAAQKGDDNEEAAALFAAAAEEAMAIYQTGGDAESLSIGVYSMLEDVFKRAKEKQGR